MRRLAPALLVAVLTSALLTGVPADARVPAGTGSIAGTLTTPDGDPIADERVALERFDGQEQLDWVSAGSLRSAADGSYRFDGIAAGTYRLWFAPQSVDPLQEYWPDVPYPEMATDIILRDGQQLVGKDAVLASPSTLDVAVTADGIPAPDADVTLLSKVGEEWWELPTRSIGNGNFRVTGLHSGRYHVQASRGGQLPVTYWPDAATVEEAEPVVVGDAAAVDIELDLLASASIKGAATSPPGGMITVEAFRRTSAGWVSESRADAASDTGSYTIRHLPPGDYRLRFDSSAYPDEWWGNTPDEARATVVHVAEGATVSGVDAHLSGGVITGRVLKGPATPAEVYVVLQRPDGAGWAQSERLRADASGHYRFERLTHGSYRLVVQTPYERDAATIPVTLAHEETRTLADTLVPPGSRISGQLRGAGASSEVRLYRLEAGGWRQHIVRSAAADGTYAVGDLAPGTYRLAFIVGGRGEVDYWPGARTLSTATSFVLGDGDVRTGMDGLYLHGASIAGVATSTDGTPLAGLDVLAIRETDLGTGPQAGHATYATTEADGTYTLSGLVPGTYRLRFQDPGGGYLLEYLDDSVGFEGAARIVVAPGATITGRDIVLAKGSTITGTAREGATPAPGLIVRAMVQDGGGWKEVASTTTGSDGTYALPRLVKGSYRVHVRGALPGGGYARQYLGGAPATDDATPLVLGDDETLAGQDLVLDDTRTISGRVSGPVGATVTVYEPVNDTWRSLLTTPITDGRYTTPRLPTGTYRIGFGDPARIRGYWQDSATLAGATSITLPADGAARNIDAVFHGSSLSGTVRADTDGPINAEVTLFRSVGGAWVEQDTTTTSAGGTFFFDYLDAGGYTLRYRDPTGALQTTYYRHSTVSSVADLDQAGTIELRQDASFGWADGALRSGGLIAGSVTSSNLSTIRVTAYRRTPSGWTVAAETLADHVNGAYQLIRLEPGDYRIGFVDYFDDSFYPEYYGGARTLDDATTVTIGTRGRRTDVDVELERRVGAYTFAAPSPPTGEVRVGGTVHAHPGTWQPEPASYRYQWLADGLPIPGATRADLQPTADLLGRSISVAVTAHLSGMRPAEATSDRIGVVGKGILVTTDTPEVAGRTRVGRTLRAKPHLTSPLATRYRYQWYAGPRPIRNAVRPRLALTDRFRGKRISVKVTALRSAYEPLVRRSPRTRTIR